jgi:hypothetical protein
MVLLVVAALGLPAVLWTRRILADEVRFAAAVAPLPTHPLIRRAVRDRSPSLVGPVLAPVLAWLLASRPAGRIWRRAAITAHRRVGRNTRRIGLVVLAAVGTLSTEHGRWRAMAWCTATLTMAFTLHAVGG